MKASTSELLRRLPGKMSAKWPDGERFVAALAHGSMSVELYAPIGLDPQTPHAQDELYFIHSGSASSSLRRPLHVRAGRRVLRGGGCSHRFENFSGDFATWAVFWGPSVAKGTT